MIVLLKLRGKWKREVVFSANRIYQLSTARPIYAKGGGGGQTQQQVVPTGPWGPQVPYIDQLFSQAQNLYQQGPVQYYPGQTVANQAPQIKFAQDAAQQLIPQQIAQAQGGANAAVQSAGAAFQNPVAQAGSASLPALFQGMNTAGQAGQPLNAIGQGLAPASIGAILNSTRGPTQYQAPIVQTGQGPFNPNQLGQLGTQGLQQVVGQQPERFGSVTNGAGSIDLGGQLQQSLQGGALNPYLDQVIQGALRSSNQNFNTNILPGIRTQANAAGQGGGLAFGGEGIAAGLASQGLQQQQGDVIAQIMNNAFNQGSAERGQALGLTAQGQQANQQAQLQTNALNQQGQQAALQQILQGAGLGLDSAQNANQSQLQALLANQQAQLGTNSLNQDARATAGQQGLAGAQIGLNTLGQGQQLGLQGAGQNVDAASSLLQGGQQAGLQQFIQSLGLLPQMQSLPLAQLGFLNNQGLQQTQFDQAQIDSNMQQYFWNQLSPYNALTQYQNFITGPYGSTTPGQANSGLPQGYQQPGYQIPQIPRFNG